MQPVQTPTDALASRIRVEPSPRADAIQGTYLSLTSFKRDGTAVATTVWFVQRGSPTKVILVDGEQLIDIMIRKNIGVRVVETHDIKELDQNYFEEA